MNVIVDTSVWSLAFRRSAPINDVYAQTLKELIVDARVVMLGAIRQEILSGIKHQEQFDRLKESLQAFPDLPLDAEDYEVAASYFNLCRNNGIQGAGTDFLMCAVASRRKLSILTTDKDFENYQSLIPINLLLKPI